MIKAIGQHGGRPLLILGLSGENLTRLMAGEPIRVDPRELSIRTPPVVVLIAGRDEATIMAQVRADGAAGALMDTDPQNPVPSAASARELMAMSGRLAAQHAEADARLAELADYTAELAGGLAAGRWPGRTAVTERLRAITAAPGVPSAAARSARIVGRVADLAAAMDRSNMTTQVIGQRLAAILADQP